MKWNIDTMDRMAKLVAVVVLSCCFVAGCGKTPTKRSTSPYSTDIERLRTLCVIPDFVDKVEWQTFAEQNEWEQTDWSLVARLTVSDEGMQALDGMLSESTTSQCWIGFSTVPTWLGVCPSNS